MSKLFLWFRQRFLSPKRGAETPAPPFDFVRTRDPGAFLTVIGKEHPQTIALVLSYINQDKASIILQNLPRDIQSDVFRRIACMGCVRPEILRIVERVLEEKLPVTTDDITLKGGVEDAAGILRLVDSPLDKYIIEALEEEDPELAEEIKKRHDDGSAKRG